MSIYPALDLRISALEALDLDFVDCKVFWVDAIIVCTVDEWMGFLIGSQA